MRVDLECLESVEALDRPVEVSTASIRLKFMKFISGWWLSGLEHVLFSFHIWDVILPIDFHSIIFQDG